MNKAQVNSGNTTDSLFSRYPADLYKTFFENNYASMMIIEPSTGKIIDANKSAENFYGYSRSALLSMKISDINVLAPEAIKDEMQQAVQQKRNYFNFQHRLASGEIRHVQVFSGPVVLGNKDYLFTLVYDITEKVLLERELHESEEKYRNLIELSPEAIFIQSEGKFALINPAGLKLFGVDSENGIIGKRIIDFVHADDRAKVLERISTLNDEKKDVSSRKERFLKADGSEIWVDAAARAIEYKGKNSALVVARNISERIEAERQILLTKKQLQDIIDGATTLIFVKDTQGRYIIINHLFEELFGIPNDQMKGKTDFSFNAKEVAEIYQQNDQKVIKSGRPEQMEEEVYLPDGRHLIYLSNKFPLYDENGKPYAVCGIASDITELKRMDNELKRTLEALNRSNTELEQFAYVASHDLQEPLRMISSFTRLLESKYKGKLDEKANEYIWFITDGTRRMSALISDLLSYSRLTKKTEAFVKTDLNIIMAEVLRDLQVAIAETKTKIEIDILPEIMVDPVKIKQLLQNLIQNAIKFRNKTAPAIKVTANNEGGLWQFCIRDNGIGIKPEYFEKIFMLFQRLHTKEDYPGTGIGLAICKKIAELHGGSIWVESEPGKGSAFFFTLKN